MAWVALFVCGLVLWAGCAGVYAMGLEVWPSEIPEAVRLAVAPVIAAAATMADKIVARDANSLFRAAVLTLIVAALDLVVLAPLVDRKRMVSHSMLGFWLPLAAIFVASYFTGVFGPM
ncbi:hypothetical protein [Roseiarcus sp.]|uniref:hypothetical protein n=1 Tax=Roseiarcus sp. TaxID=1969460 RepID=UPI003F951F52